LDQDPRRIAVLLFFQQRGSGFTVRLTLALERNVRGDVDGQQRKEADDWSYLFHFDLSHVESIARDSLSVAGRYHRPSILIAVAFPVMVRSFSIEIMVCP